MSRRTPRRGRLGRPTACTPANTQRIAEAIENGVPITHAGALIGVHTATIFLWMGRGQDAAEATDPHTGHPTPIATNDRCYVEFYEAVTRARARASEKAVKLVLKAAEGGYVVRETTRRYRNDAGHWVNETDKVYAPVDWRAAGWFLDRSDRANWGRGAAEVQLSGPGGGPIEVGPAAFEALASRLRMNFARLSGDPAALPAGDSYGDSYGGGAGGGPGGGMGGGRTIDGEVDRAS